MKDRKSILLILAVVALCVTLVVSGCSQGAEENKSSGSSSNNDQNGSKAENNGEDADQGAAMSQEEAYGELDEALSIPLFVLGSVPEGFEITRQLPEKPNPEVMGEGENKEATLTYVNDDKTIVLTFGVSGDLGDVETKDVKVAGYEGTLYETEADGKPRSQYTWTVEEGGKAVPYTIQFSGLEPDEAAEIVATLKVYEPGETTDATATTETTEFDLDDGDDSEETSTSMDDDAEDEHEAMDEDEAENGSKDDNSGSGGSGE